MKSYNAIGYPILSSRLMRWRRWFLRLLVLGMPSFEPRLVSPVAAKPRRRSSCFAEAVRERFVSRASSTLLRNAFD